MNTPLKSTKGRYLLKTPRTYTTDLPMCPTCSKCDNREKCNNRKIIRKMRQCEDCKNCEYIAECDKFYKTYQYRMTLTIGVNPHTQKPIKKSFSASTEEEVIYKAMKFKKEYENGDVEFRTKASPRTFVDLAMEMIDSKLKEGEIRENSYLTCINTINRIKACPWAEQDICYLRKKDIIDFLTEERVKSNSIIAKDYGMIKRVVKIAHYRRLLPVNYFEGEYPIKLPKSILDDKKVSALTKTDEERIIEYLEANEDTTFRNVFLLALNTGMRVGEILALQVQDINFFGKVISINKTVTRDKKGKAIIGSTKTQSSTRDIIITPKVEKILRNSLKKCSNSPETFIFGRKDGTLYAHGAVNDRLHRICKKLNIKKTNMHMLRHTFATRSLEAGVNYKALQSFLGHADIETTLNTYAESQDDFKRAEMEKYIKYMENRNEDS